ncbi:MAG: hypothetical protein AAGJ46_20945 [Planctomycetota bacterium]
MDGPSREEFERLQREVRRLVALVMTQAQHQQALLAFTNPTEAAIEPPEPEELLTRSEAQKRLKIAKTKFFEVAKLLSIEPVQHRGKAGLYTVTQIDRIASELQRQQE